MIPPKILLQRFSLAALVVATMGLAACYPGGDYENNSDYDMVIAVRDNNATFSPTTTPGVATTYYLPSVVTHLTPPGQNDDMSHAYDPYVTARINQNMQRLGYTPAASQATADIQFRLAASKQDWSFYWYDYGWCYYYYWSCYPGYGSTYTYSTGTLFIEWFPGDPNNVRPSWLCAINGLMNSSSVVTRINMNIDTCFAQSPYLGGR